MRKGWKIAVAFVCFFASLPFAFPMERAVACSCMFPDNAHEGTERAAAVFTGTVEDKQKDDASHMDFYDKVTLRVNESWKGVADAEVVVYTSWSSCQFDFVKGKTYLLYPYEREGRLEVTNCGRSGETVQANADVMNDLQELGPGKTFEEPPGARIDEAEAAKRTGARFWLPAGLGVAALIGMIALVGMRLRRRRP